MYGMDDRSERHYIVLARDANDAKNLLRQRSKYMKNIKVMKSVPVNKRGVVVTLLEPGEWVNY